MRLVATDTLAPGEEGLSPGPALICQKNVVLWIQKAMGMVVLCLILPAKTIVFKRFNSAQLMNREQG